MTDIKKRAMREFPEIIGFLESFYREENAPYFEKFADDIAQIRQTAYAKIHDGVDYSLFREDIDGANIVRYLKWLFDAYETETAKRFRDEAFDLNDEQSAVVEWQRFYAFMDDLRKAFYREG
jgi:hypothetical protein